ncbi:amino acid ABC transporter ATP-binding protein [Erwinia sp. S38]|uniref:amino acid ABC transporter ATP-binding protein n=1 Tax=Erwinia sp. S38 TaxID=2769338 RepID=UPI00190AD018|nr:amino acid ABC transporter ATP-binding protein [Erwinia sp. S38]MBK0003583.1 amino acid ABC transporter ATP-binding protein [Erwinia sp. S38]
MMSNGPILELRNVGKSFGSNRVLAGINLAVNAGEIVTLIGPSGSGKTTALRCMNFLEAYDEGEILIKGQLLGYSGTGREPKHRDGAGLIADVRRPLAMVFQQFNLWPHLTVLENVCAPLVLGKKMSRDDARKKATAALAQVGMLEKAQARPARLSGGQQQRVGIARALALEPELLLLDEPTSALDPERVEEVLDVIKALANNGMTMVMVTHEMSFAAKISSRVVFMADGSVIESGAPATLFRQPQTERLKSFLAPWFKRPLQLDDAEATHA